jgi:hypothetical protein
VLPHIFQVSMASRKRTYANFVKIKFWNIKIQILVEMGESTSFHFSPRIVRLLGEILLYIFVSILLRYLALKRTVQMKIIL